MLTNLICIGYGLLNTFLLFGLRGWIVNYFALSAFESNLLLFLALFLLLLVTVPLSILFGEKTAKLIGYT